jgi:hypothetical protein
MSEDPFNLRGPQGSYSGRGDRYEETWISSTEVSLKQGIVIADIEHHGPGDFKLSFAPKVDGSWLKDVSGSLFDRKQTLAEGEGEIHTYRITRVKEDEEGSLTPGPYWLEMKSEGRWSCRFIQPALGQSKGPLVDADEGGSAGRYVIGPFTSGSRPVGANVHHRGGGNFFAIAYSVDGTHQCTVYTHRGQFIVEDRRPEIRPGKEYIIIIGADGDWGINFTEGY